MQSETDKAFLSSLLPPLALHVENNKAFFPQQPVTMIFKIQIKKLEMLLANYNLFAYLSNISKISRILDG